MGQTVAVSGRATPLNSPQGISGIELMLLNAEMARSHLATETTDADGLYSFIQPNVSDSYLVVGYRGADYASEHVRVPLTDAGPGLRRGKASPLRLVSKAAAPASSEQAAEWGTSASTSECLFVAAGVVEQPESDKDLTERLAFLASSVTAQAHDRHGAAREFLAKVSTRAAPVLTNLRLEPPRPLRADGQSAIVARMYEFERRRPDPMGPPKPRFTASVDPRIPRYRSVERISGKLTSVGSDSVNSVMTLWAEGFHQRYPDTQFEIEGKGSSTAPTALIGGSAQFGPMSRMMQEREVAEFENKYGYRPTGLATSIDMLAVYVHKDNPIKGLTLQQVDAIFSKSRKGGLEKDVRTWGDLGLTGEWADKPISLYGRNSASGTYGFFKEHALFNGDYKDSVKEQPGSSSVVQGVASDKYGMGYGGIGYKTADVKAVPLAAKVGQPFVEAAPENAYSGDYPMSRFLWLYVNHKPGSQLDPVRREFIRYIYSREGQEDAIQAGYWPLPAELVAEQLSRLGL